jgi:hypothetical protein
MKFSVRPLELRVPGCGKPLANNPGELVGRHVGVRGHHEFQHDTLATGGKGLQIAIQHGFERPGGRPGN